MTHVIDADSATLQHHINTSKVPLLLDFSASWCGPCKSMAPHLERFAEARGETLRVLKIDIDESPEDARRFMIRSVPTLMVMVDGKVLAVKSGALTGPQLAAFVDAKR